MKNFLIDVKTLFLRGTFAFPLLLILAFGNVGYLDYFLCFFAVCVIAFCLRKVPLDRECVLLIAFAVSYTLIFLANGYYHTIPHSFGFFFSFFTFYIYGRFIVKRVPSERALLNLLLLVTLLICLPYYIETFKDIKESGLINVSRAITLEDEEVDDDNRINATIVGIMVSYGLAGLGTFFSFKNKTKSLYCWSFIAISLLSLLVNIHIVNRAGIVVFISCLLLSVFYQLRAKNTGMLVWGVIFILLCLVLVPNVGDLGDDIVSVYQDRALDDESSMGNRGDIWKKNIPHLFADFFGWREKTGFAHNLWLDFARECGIIPFVLFLLFSILTIKTAYRLFLIRNSPLICFILGIDTAILLYCMVEPVFQANRCYFYVSCFVWGIQSQLIKMKVVPSPVK